MNELDSILKHRIDKNKSNIILVIVPNFTLIKKYADDFDRKKDIKKIEYTKKRIVLNDGTIIKFMRKEEIYIGVVRGVFFKEVNFYE